jgi:predicted secreted acid phosphatase
MNKFFRAFFYIACFSAVSMGSVFAKEPENLDTLKAQVKQYHDSGQYAADIQQTIQSAQAYLQNRLKGPLTKPAMILDIDETSLSNYKDMVAMDFGGDPQYFKVAEDKGTDPAIQPTLALYQFAKNNHIAVFFLTGRFEEERGVTARNLRAVGYRQWDGLILRHGMYRKTSAEVYKTAMRKQLIAKGYDIVLSIGDQNSDLIGGYADKTFKLVNPYYLIP